MSLSAPTLRKQGDVTQLIVDGAPFLMIGGELHNSSSSDLAYMEPIWERLKALHLTTVFAVVSWELIEPVEGAFDFNVVDGLIHAARSHNLRLVLLWFGSWKNGMSSYVPAWVKRDSKRFPRAKRGDGASIEVLSTLSAANWEADARAFAALMSHLQEVDGSEHTVLMVQVENEVGLLGDSRDRSEAANAEFAAAVPLVLMNALQEQRADLHSALRERWETAGAKSAGTWQEVFGTGPATDELFMAWNYARYVEHVAAAGKAAYALPLFVNAWLNAVVNIPGQPAGGQAPGDWPSGGPLPHTLDVWRIAAPHLDVFSPDIYFGDFQEWCREYTRRDNALLIPEMRRDHEGARNVFVAVGEYGAIGVSPFGIDSLDNPADSPLAASYSLLGQLAPLILEHQATGRITGFVLDAEHPSITRELGGYELQIELERGPGGRVEHGYGLLIATGPEEFVGAGYGFQVKFGPTATGSVGIEAVDEGTYCAGQWSPGRRLNGDETFSGGWWRFPAVERAASSFPIPLLGAGTGIGRCRVYRYE